MSDHYASGKLVGSSPAEKLGPVGFQTVKSLEHPESFLLREKKLNPSFDSQAVGNKDSGLGKRLSSNVMSASCFPEGSMGAEYENSLFSSSLSELFTRKMRITANHSLYGHSFDNVASHYEEEEPFESLEEMEAQTIGNLLPNDDDLFSAVTDGLDMAVQSTGGDDVDELDLFNSVGGMDLGDDASSLTQKTSEFSGEHSSRMLFVRNINGNAEDSELTALLKRYGDIRTLYTACKHRGFIVVAYYDIRSAQNAMKSLHNRLLKGTKLDLHYSISKENFSEEDVNQGTLVIYNLDSYFPNDKLREIFGVYGDIREMHAAPHRSDHRFIEFYDTRSAETAARELDRVDIGGKQIRVELSRDPHQTSPPSNSSIGSSGANGHGHALNNGATVGVQSAIRASFLDPAFHYGISSSVPNSFPSLVKAESTGQLSSFHESGHLQGQLKFNVHGSPTLQPHSLPEYHDGLTNGVHGNLLGHMAANINHKLPEIFDNRRIGRVGSNGHSVKFNEAAFGSTISGNGSLPGNHYGWSNSYHIPRPPGMMWQNSPTFVNGVGTTHPSMQMHGLPRAPSLVPNTVVPINNHHVGSAPVVNHSLWERRHSYGGESPDASAFHPGSLGSMRLNNSPQSMEFLSHNLFSHNGMELPKSVGLQAHHQRAIMLPGKGQMIHMMNAIDSPNERVRSRRNEGSASQADKKQYELDIDHILRGGDIRTTLMIKNIPNKYTSKMLLAAIDEQHRGTYDFIYLPIDFKNKCNVGYAFINMIDPKCIVPFYQAFNGKKWEKFNSEKVASLAYARIQGKSALVAHFQNSSLMNEDKRCRPILFNTEGPNAGDQIPFPMGVNVRTRSGKARIANQGENPQDNSMNGEDYCNGEASSKDPD